MTTSTISTEVANFVTQQNQFRGSGGVALDYSALSGTVPAGGNSVTGYDTLIPLKSTLALGSGYNAIVLGGLESVQSSEIVSPDNFAVSVGADGTVTLLDENYGQTLTVTGDTYLLFNGGIANPDGSYQLKIVGGGSFADIALMYGAAFERQPDLAGLEFYAKPIAAGTMDLHQAATYFLASTEFAQDYPALTAPADEGGPNDLAFITELYGNILHRAPSATEIAYYIEALQGSLTSSSGQAIPAADRAQLLIYFSISQENQHNSTWLIDTDNGAYSDPGAAAPNSLFAWQALTVPVGGVINTNSIYLGSILPENSVSVNGGNTDGGITVIVDSDLIESGETGVTIYLSQIFSNADLQYAHGDIVYGIAKGGSTIKYGLNGNSVHLQGDENLIENANADGYDFQYLETHAAPAPILVYGFTGKDFIAFDRDTDSSGGAFTVQILPTPSAGTKIQGASLINAAEGTAATPVPGHYFDNTTFAVNVGTLADSSAATMAAAAAKIYQPTANLEGPFYDGWESIVFFGQGPNKDTIVYKWFADWSHTVSATTLVGGVDLMGVAPSQLAQILWH